MEPFLLGIGISIVVCSIFTGTLTGTATVVLPAKKKGGESKKRGKSKNNTGGDEETAMNLIAKRSKKLSVTLESLERRMESMRTEIRGLVESMDKARDVCRNKIQLLQLIHSVGSILLLLNYPTVSILMLFIHIYFLEVNLREAGESISKTGQLVRDFQRRQIELQKGVENLKVKIEQLNSDYKLYNTKNLNTQMTVLSETSRIATLQIPASEISEILKFEGDQRGLINEDAIGAYKFGIYFSIIAYFFRCFVDFGNVPSCFRK